MGNCLQIDNQNTYPTEDPKQKENTSRKENNYNKEEVKEDLKDFKEEVKDFKEEVKDFKEEVKDFKEEVKEEIKDFKEEIKEEVKDFKEEIKDFKEEVKEEIKEEDIYKNYTDENTPVYTFEGLKKKVKVLRIIDGDTVDIALHHKESDIVFKHRVRLYGIDTPEKRPSKNDPNRDKEIAASKRSSEALTEYLRKNDFVVLSLFYKNDKYGRLMCTFYDKDGGNINKWMIDNGYAYEYFGKTKQKYNEQEESNN
jgi:endonuclease YncB( thermonuclease family)